MPLIGYSHGQTARCRGAYAFTRRFRLACRMGPAPAHWMCWPARHECFGGPRGALARQASLFPASLPQVSGFGAGHLGGAGRPLSAERGWQPAQGRRRRNGAGRFLGARLRPHVSDRQQRPVAGRASSGSSTLGTQVSSVYKRCELRPPRSRGGRGDALRGAADLRGGALQRTGRAP